MMNITTNNDYDRDFMRSLGDHDVRLHGDEEDDDSVVETGTLKDAKDSHDKHTADHDDDDDDDQTSTSNNTRNKEESNQEEVAKLAQQETKNVQVWRRNVILMILAMGALVTTLTFIFLRDEDQEDFTTAVRLFHTLCLFCIILLLCSVLQCSRTLII
jgi:hypothetical protein